jgi:hypothetical protein
MDKIEKEMLQKWNKEKEAGKISIDTVQDLMHGKFARYRPEMHPN